jgi:hypothetical protein
MPVGDNVTSRIVWNKLKSMYSHVDVHAQFDLRDRLAANTLQNPSDYIRFLGEFNTCRSCLATMGAPLSKIESVHTLLRQLPHDTTWPHFKKSISHFVQTWSEIEATLNQYFTLPPLVRADSEDSPSSPRTVLGVRRKSEQSEDKSERSYSNNISILLGLCLDSAWTLLGLC